MLTAEANRAARGLLDWTLEDLARESGVAFGTLSRFENGRAIRSDTETKIVAALDANGVELLGDNTRTGAVLVHARRKPQP